MTQPQPQEGAKDLAQDAAAIAQHADGVKLDADGFVLDADDAGAGTGAGSDSAVGAGTGAEDGGAGAYGVGAKGDEDGVDGAEEYNPLEGMPVMPSSANKDVFKLSLKWLTYLVVALLVLGVGIGALVAGSSGVWGALLGVAITLVFSGTTIWSMLFTADKAPTTTMGVVMGAWIVKMLIFVVALAVLAEFDFYHKVVFVVVLLIGAIGSAALDMLAVTKVRAPYVIPQSK